MALKSPIRIIFQKEQTGTTDSMAKQLESSQETVIIIIIIS